MDSVLWFIAIALLSALGLWAIGQIPNMDQAILKYIRIAVIVLLTVMLINVLFVLIFARSLAQVLRGGG